MNRNIIVLLVSMFTVAGLLDILVCNIKENNAENVYLAELFNHGFSIGDKYEINGKSLRFEDNCNTVHYDNYQLINALGDTIQPMTTFIETNNGLKRYILFDDLKYDFYKLNFTTAEEQEYTSRNITINESITLSYNDLMASFYKNDTDVTKELPLTVYVKTNENDCFGTGYTFYYDKDDLFIDYMVGSSLLNEEPFSQIFKVEKEILPELQMFANQLREDHQKYISNDQRIQVDFLNKSIKTYRSYNKDFNFDSMLWNAIQKYKIE